LTNFYPVGRADKKQAFKIKRHYAEGLRLKSLAYVKDLMKLRRWKKKIQNHILYAIVGLIKSVIQKIIAAP